MTAVSFIIANYNYAEYVAEAIESALNSDWEDIEVIVVDDGSTDGSRAIIESFGDRVQAVFKPNGGQRTANNVGFARSKGDLVVFLDADDVVVPSFARRVALAWRPGVSKIQVQMVSIDKSGTQIGSPFPVWPTTPTPDEIRTWITRTSEYPTPPGSGNVYARTFLERFFPLGEEHDSFTDSTTLPLAPIFGDVITIREPLVLYRRHGANDSSLIKSDHIFGREVARAMRRQVSAAAICSAHSMASPPVDIIRRSWYVLQLRVGSLVMKPGSHPYAGDDRARVIADALRGIFVAGSEPLKRRIKIAVWVIATMVAPAPLAKRSVQARFKNF